MDFLRKSVEDAEKLRQKLPKLRENPSIEGMIEYNEALLEATERQHNIYTRLRLMGDEESTQTADEMVHVAEKYLDKPEDVTMDEYFKHVKEQVLMQIGLLTPGQYGEEDDWFWI